MSMQEVESRIQICQLVLTNKERGPFYKYFMYSDEAAPEVTCRDTMYAVE
ncbi:MAG: hypothetical protein IPN89_10845 [Saprospiraceae bacterium]|nr:hypothetical protein [Saprospiraceae bacterium]